MTYNVFSGTLNPTHFTSLPLVHQSPNPGSKSIASAIFAQLMAEQCRAHWRHLANTTEFVLPLAHPSPQPKQRIDRFSRFCTAHGRMSLHFTTVPLSPKIAPCHGGSGPPSNTWFPGSTRVLNPNGISIGSAIFAGHTSVTGRLTDYTTRSVTTNNRPHLHLVLRCGQKINLKTKINDKTP